MHRKPQRQGNLVAGYTRHPGSIWIDQNRSSLPNDTWVATNDTGLVAEDSTFDGLIKEIKARDTDPGDVTIAFITEDSN